MSWLGSCNDLEDWLTSAIIVNVNLVILINGLRRVLFHLNSLNQDMVLIFFIVVEEEATIAHDWLMLLRDLVRLWQV